MFGAYVAAGSFYKGHCKRTLDEMNNITTANAAPTHNNSNAASTPKDSGDEPTIHDLIAEMRQLRRYAIKAELNLQLFKLLNAATPGGRRSAFKQLSDLKLEERRMALNS